MTPELRRQLLGGLAMAEAQLELARTQLAICREAIGIAAPAAERRQAQGPTTEACPGFEAELRALINEDARQSLRSFATPHRVRCAGCREEGDLAA